jgi:hypothetical protein
MFNRLLRGGRGQGRGGGGQGKRQGMGGGNKPGSGPSGNCVCSKCGYKEEHLVSERCVERKCPKCGTQMVRE